MRMTFTCPVCGTHRRNPRWKTCLKEHLPSPKPRKAKSTWGTDTVKYFSSKFR